MKASIITIGDEILIGQIVDTNSVSIARHLNGIGIVVREKISIGDDRRQIIDTVNRARENNQVTIITGGLGPTKDDITKKTLAELFHSTMRYDETVAAHVEKMPGGLHGALQRLRNGPRHVVRMRRTCRRLAARRPL